MLTSEFFQKISEFVNLNKGCLLVIGLLCQYVDLIFFVNKILGGDIIKTS